MGQEQNEIGNTLFLWVLCQEYFLQQDALELGTAVSVPVALLIKKQGKKFEIERYRMPKEGSYVKDIRSVFPKHIWKRFKNQRVNTLIKETEEQASKYFGVSVDHSNLVN